MTTEHDFQKALRAVKSWSKDWNSHNEATLGDMVFINHEDEIMFALRLADKLMKQEPSFEMKQAGSQKVGSDYEVRGTFGIAEDTFKSMLTTAVKEIENGD